jgi:fatty-acid desaturase
MNLQGLPTECGHRQHHRSGDKNSDPKVNRASADKLREVAVEPAYQLLEYAHRARRDHVAERTQALWGHGCFTLGSSMAGVNLVCIVEL